MANPCFVAAVLFCSRFGTNKKVDFSKLRVVDNTWSFVCVVYVQHLGIAKTFFNGKVILLHFQKHAIDRIF